MLKGVDIRCDVLEESIIDVAGMLCVRNCMKLVCWVGQLQTTLGIGSDAKKEGSRERFYAQSDRAGCLICA